MYKHTHHNHAYLTMLSNDTYILNLLIIFLAEAVCSGWHPRDEDLGTEPGLMNWRTLRFLLKLDNGQKDEKEKIIYKLIKHILLYIKK